MNCSIATRQSNCETKPMCVVTDHAVDRWIERVAPVDRISARDEIMASSNAIHCAAEIGCNTVKLGNGARLRLVGETVVTVLPKRGR